MHNKGKQVDLQQLAVEIGKRLRQYREEACLSLRDMADGAGVTRQQLRRYEMGHDLPQTSALVRLTLYTGRSAQWILLGEDADGRVPEDPDVRECMFDLEAASPECRRMAVQTVYALITADRAEAKVRSRG